MLTFNKNYEKYIKKYSHNIFDTGSTEIQILIINNKINKINLHLIKNKKDKDAKKSIIILKSKMIKLFKYLKKKKNQIYIQLIEDLKLKKI